MSFSRPTSNRFWIQSCKRKWENPVCPAGWLTNGKGKFVTFPRSSVWKWIQLIQPEFELGIPVPFSAPITTTLHAYSHTLDSKPPHHLTTNHVNKTNNSGCIFEYVLLSNISGCEFKRLFSITFKYQFTSKIVFPNDGFTFVWLRQN